MAISSPLLENVQIHGAQAVLINITGSSAMTLSEVHEAATLVQEAASDTANIIFGSVIDERMGDSMRITVIATGFDSVAEGVVRRDQEGGRILRSVATAAAPRRTMTVEDEFFDAGEVVDEAPATSRPVIRLGRVTDPSVDPRGVVSPAPTDQINRDEGRGLFNRRDKASRRTRGNDADLDEYDIPTFLRRSAD
ncbi:hypothetical protein KDL45_05100, partial [bacterium]|nr:hypothetical protein [bacterium]